MNNISLMSGGGGINFKTSLVKNQNLSNDGSESEEEECNRQTITEMINSQDKIDVSPKSSEGINGINCTQHDDSHRHTEPETFVGK